MSTARPLGIREDELLGSVAELARALRWRVAHFRPARTERGWRTAVQFDGKGFPDLVMVRGPRLIFAELKSARGQVSEEQRCWLEDLLEVAAVADVGVFVWTPADWLSGAIEEELRRK